MAEIVVYAYCDRTEKVNSAVRLPEFGTQRSFNFSALQRLAEPVFHPGKKAQKRRR